MTSAVKASRGRSADSAAPKRPERKRRAQCRGPVVAAAAAGAALLLALAPDGAARAQQGPVVVGGSGQPDVQVNWGALGGGYGGRRQLLMPNSKLPQSGPIVLRPPGTYKVGGLKPPSQKAKKPVEPATAMTEEAAPAPAPAPEAPTPPPAPKLAAPKVSEMPPPPPAKKVAPVESAPLPAEKTEAMAPPPAPPEAPPAAKPAQEKETKAAKETSAAKEKTEAAVPPPPPAGKYETGESAEAPPPPPPPPPPAPEAKSESAQTATAAPPPPPPPPAAAEKAPAAGAPPGEVAALAPPGQAIAVDKPTAISFAVGSAALADAAKARLGEVTQALNANADLRLQIVAYASGGDEDASQARRLSLSRALAVRSYLIDNGIRSTRMDVRALGNKFDSGPGDRVDLVIVKP